MGPMGAEAWVRFKGQQPYEANSNHSSASDLSNLALTAEGWLLFCFGLQGVVERHSSKTILL
jgi:hypothetical protein